MNIIKPPEYPSTYSTKSVFLAGSIEMGKAVNWQKKVELALSGIDGLTIFNPRRDDWNSAWEQSISNTQFKGQVDWELNMLDKCSIAMMYFDPTTASPISLMELGLYADTGKLIICCPEDFYRKGNVDIVCERYGIPVVETLEELIDLTKKKLTDLFWYDINKDPYLEGILKRVNFET